MFVSDSTRLRHMYDAAQKTTQFIQGRTRQDLDIDEMLTLSLVKCIEIIGEAAASVTREKRAELNQIPWANIIGMRNRLVHAYFAIDLDIVWDTVTQALPELIAKLETIIAADCEE